MFAKTVLTEEERVVDNQLGYPRGYGKLCRHAYIQMQGLITPYTEGPPQRFQPYSPLEEEMKKLKEFDDLFPYVNEEERDPANARRHAEFLWQQLDHLGNAGFDPAKFRIDMYGNVLYWNADPASPLAWEVDHWFPHSRGGKTVVGNLRIVQWQVNQKKGTKLEFLVPWWDLQIGISVNQFLSAFSSKNTEFRQRAFALFFQGGENEQLDDTLVAECHSWPRHFCERKIQVGPAAAAIVKVQKTMDDTLRVLNHNRTTAPIATTITTKQTYQAVNSATPIRRRWTSDEEEALRRAVQKVGPGNWKEIKELEPMLVNRSTVQIKDKFRIMKGEWKVDKENKEDATSVVVCGIQKEEKRQKAQEEEKKQKEEELLLLEEELKLLRSHNDEEKSVLEELERILAKERKRVEKQRKWSETQSQYRLCLDKMIRDTMHQCVVYKEQARLNQAACNALLARLESQKATCDAAEMDLMRRVKQRESLEALVRPTFIKRNRNEEHADVGACVKPTSITKMGNRKEWPSQLFDNPKRIDFHQSRIIAKEESMREHSSANTTDSSIEEDSIDSLVKEEYSASNEVEEEEEDDREVDIFTSKEPQEADAHHRSMRCSSDHDRNPKVAPKHVMGNSGMKRKSLEMNDMEAFFFEDEEANVEESTGDNGDFDIGSIRDEAEDAPPRFNGETWQHNKEVKEKVLVPRRTQDDEQLDELLQEVLEMKGKVNAAMVEATKDDEEEDEEERVKRMGKFNLDKWLKKLLLDPEAEKEDEEQHQLEKEEPPIRAVIMPNAESRAQTKAQHVDVNADHSEPALKKKNKVDGGKKAEKSRHILSPWRRRPSTNHTFKRAASNINIPDTNNVSSRRRSKGYSDIKDLKIEELRVISSLAGLKLNTNGHVCVKEEVGEEDEEEECPEVAFQIECENEFVEKMRARRERDEHLKRQQSAGIHPKLQDFLVDSPSQVSTDNLERDHCGSPSVVSMPSPSASPGKTVPSLVRVQREGQRELKDLNHISSNIGEKESIKAEGRMDRRHSLIGEEMKPKHEGRQLIWLPEVNKAEMMHNMELRHHHHHHRHRSVSAVRTRRGSSSVSPRRRGTERSLSTPPVRVQLPTASERKEGRFGRQLSEKGMVGPVRKMDKATMVKRNNNNTGPSLERGRQGWRCERGLGLGQDDGDGNDDDVVDKEEEGEERREVAAASSPPPPPLKKSSSSFFFNQQLEWEANNNGTTGGAESGFRASLSNVWKKAVKKFDMAR